MSLQGEIRSVKPRSESGSAIHSILVSFAITLVSILGFAESALAQIVVNTTADFELPDPDPNQGLTSLREAILLCDGLCLITFNIPAEDPGFDGETGTFAIRLNPALGPLPGLPSDVHIDGTSQAAFLGDSNPDGPEIIIDGSQLDAPAPGFEINNRSNVTIRHLVIQGFPGHGILIRGFDFPSNNSIIGNYIGTNAQGTATVPNKGDGIHLEGSVVSTLIRDNLIGGNDGWGVFADVFYGDNNSNRLQSNGIGSSFSGETLGNRMGGVHLDSFGDSIGIPLLFIIDGVENDSRTPGARSRPIERAERGTTLRRNPESRSPSGR
jgi:hypothetical protein